MKHTRIPTKYTQVQLAHARRFRAIKSCFTAHKRPFMSRYRWLYTLRSDRDSHLHRIKCVASGRTLWMRETILHRDAAKALLKSLETLQNLHTTCLPRIVGISGCPTGNERWRVILVTERCRSNSVLEGNEAWSDEKTLDLARVLTTSICALHTSGLFHGNLDKKVLMVSWQWDEKERMCIKD